MIVHSFDYPPSSGGISRLCAAIAEGLGREGVCVRALTQSASSPDGPVAPAVPEIRVPAARPLREWRALQVLWRAHEPVLSGIWYPEGLLATLARRRPRVVLAHGSELFLPEARWRRRLWASARRWVLESADLVVANSRYTRDLVLAVAPGAAVATVLLAVDHHRFSPGDRNAARQELGLAAHHRVVCSVSRIHTYKGLDVVFRALAALAPPERQHFVYLIAGRGPDRPRLQALAARLGVGRQVRWLGFVPEHKLAQVYRAADLFVLCTRERAARQEVEGFGLVFLEAQACGVPVVGTRAGGIPDAVAEGEGGWLIAEDDVAALARHLRRLDAAPADFSRAGALARARVERQFTWASYQGRLAAALANLPPSPRPRSP